MPDNPATRFKQRPSPHRPATGARVRIHPPANDNRTGRLMRIAAIVAAIVALLWLFGD